jgi:predicted DNA-binding transcriptional regulator YafY
MMKRATDTLTRQWTMLKHVPAHPHWISTKGMFDYLNKEGHDITLRTIQRDLDRLSVDFPLISMKEGRENLWQWTKGAHALEIPSMTPTTALVFQLVEQYLNPMLPRSTLELIKPYLDRASEIMKTTSFHGWRKSVRMLNRGPRLIPPPLRTDIRDVVYTALLEKKRFEVIYRARARENAVEYLVNPLGLVIKEGITYMVCSLWDYKDLKQLALHRMQSATLTDTPAVRHRGFDLDTYIDQDSGFAYPVSINRLKLKIRMENVAAFHLYESKLSKDQQIKKLNENEVQLTATVADCSEIRWWLLGFGDQVEVLGPKKLRKEFAEISQNLHGFYS